MKKIVPILTLLFTAIGVLVYVGVVYASVPVLRVAELKTKYREGEVRVDDGKIVAIESLAPLRFTVAPEKNPSATLLVESRRTVPENFKIGGDVSLIGEYDPARNVLTAYRVTTTCPSKYEASKEAGQDAEGASPYAAPGSSLPALPGTTLPRLGN